MSERVVDNPANHGWVEVDGKWVWDAAGGGAGAGMVISETEPTDKVEGMQWLNPTTGLVLFWDDEKWLQMPTTGAAGKDGKDAVWSEDADGANYTGTVTVNGELLAAKAGAGANALAVGYLAGQTTQGKSAVAVGWESGSVSQAEDGVAIGRNAGQTTQGEKAVSVGRDAGFSNQGSYGVGVGFNAGKTDQGDSSVAIGRSSGATSQSDEAIAVGRNAGNNTQGSYAVAVGSSAGDTNQGDYGVSVGYNAGKTTQGSGAVAIGGGAGFTGQGASSVAIGPSAGETNQGADAIAIGRSAGKTDQAANGIIISATGTAESNSTPNHIELRSPTASLKYNGTDSWTFSGGPVNGISGFRQNGVPVIDAKGLISTLSTLRNATKDETTLEGMRDALADAIGGLIEGFEHEIATQEIAE